jgi:DNA-binding transcriptional regulator YdaS (Cro superfamily)
MSDETPIEKACRLAGGQAELAGKLRVTPQAVNQWVRSQRLPADRCPAIELELAAQVAVEELRPDVKWHRVTDATWPHAKGRPLVDFMPEPA